MGTAGYVHRSIEGTKGGPLFFVFHGTGADETQFLGLGQDLLRGATVVAPRGDVLEHGAARYFRRTAEGIYDMADLARATAKMADFVADHVQERRPSTVIGLGYSNGANILASVLFEMPDLFDAAVLMHPLIPFRPEPKDGLDRARILMTAGRRDPICPPDLTIGLEEILRDCGADVKTVWHDGGHEIRQQEITAAEAFLAPFAMPT